MFFCKWCSRTVFPGLNDGTYIEVLQENSTPGSDGTTTKGTPWSDDKAAKGTPWVDCLASKGWVGKVTTLTPSAETFLAYLRDQETPSYIHCAVFHDPDWIKSCRTFPYRAYRFGALVFGIEGAKRKHQYRLRKVLEENHYQQVAKRDGYVYYRSQLGSPPFYVGQVAYSRYRILGNFKSGCGSKGVYLVGGLAGPGRGRRDLVLKRCNSEKVFLRELEALRRTESWPHSPQLVDFIASERVIVTNWCGDELRKAKKKVRQQVAPYIQSLVRELYRNYKLYHNDIRWKNITRRGDRVYLVDWGMSGDISRERDAENILGTKEEV